MNDETHAVIAIKYLVNLSTLRTVKKFEVLGVFSDKTEEDMKAFSDGCALGLETMKSEIDKDFCMLSTYDIQRMIFKGIVSLDDVQKWVKDNCCYEWGKDWKSDIQQQRKL